MPVAAAVVLGQAIKPSIDGEFVEQHQAQAEVLWQDRAALTLGGTSWTVKQVACASRSLRVFPARPRDESTAALWDKQLAQGGVE